MILSAVFHYISDLKQALKQITRVVSDALTMDVWIIEDDDSPKFQYVERFDGGYWIPNKSALMTLLRPHFDTITVNGYAISPDASKRLLVQCRSPKPTRARAVLVYGPPRSGKSTYGRMLARTQGFIHLQTDFVYVSWFYNNTNKIFNAGYTAKMMRGKCYDDIMSERLATLKRWLLHNQARDIVIEGYDLSFDDEREQVKLLLRELGWQQIEEVSLPARK